MSEHGTCLRRYRLHPNDLHRSAHAERTASDQSGSVAAASHKTWPKSTRSKRWKMRKSWVAITCMVLAGTLGLSSPAWAQQKTVKACQEEWRADKAANQTKGITEKAYVAECRSSGAAAQPVTPAAKPAASPQAATGQKTIKVCQEEWRANKATNQANGITEKSYVVQCRARGTAAQSPPSTPAAQTPATTPPAPSTPPASSTVRRAPETTGSTAPSGSDQFSAEAEAKGHCPSDIVVWVNLRSRIYHYAGHKSYGKTKTGAYMCERDTAAQGMRASKIEKRPG
jgi:hypothetical protein